MCNENRVQIPALYTYYDYTISYYPSQIAMFTINCVNEQFSLL